MISWWQNLDSSDQAAWTQAFGTIIAFLLGAYVLYRESRLRRSDATNRASNLIVESHITRRESDAWIVTIHATGTHAFYDVHVEAIKNVRAEGPGGSSLMMSDLNWISTPSFAASSEEVADVVLPSANNSVTHRLAVLTPVAGGFQAARADVTVRFTDSEGGIWIRTGADPPKRFSKLRSRMIRHTSARQRRRTSDFFKAQHAHQMNYRVRQSQASLVRASRWYENDSNGSPQIECVNVVNASDYDVTEVIVRTITDPRVEKSTLATAAEIWFRGGPVRWHVTGTGQAQSRPDADPPPARRAAHEFHEFSPEAWTVAIVPAHSERRLDPLVKYACG